MQYKHKYTEVQIQFRTQGLSHASQIRFSVDWGNEKKNLDTRLIGLKYIVIEIKLVKEDDEKHSYL